MADRGQTCADPGIVRDLDLAFAVRDRNIEIDADQNLFAVYLKVANGKFVHYTTVPVVITSAKVGAQTSCLWGQWASCPPPNLSQARRPLAPQAGSLCPVAIAQDKSASFPQ